MLCRRSNGLTALLLPLLAVVLRPAGLERWRLKRVLSQALQTASAIWAQPLWPHAYDIGLAALVFTPGFS